MGKKRANQPGYVKAKGKDGRIIWVPDGKQTQFPNEVNKALKTLKGYGIQIDNAENQYTQSKDVELFQDLGMDELQIEFIENMQDNDIKNYLIENYNDIDYCRFEIIAVAESVLYEDSKAMFKQLYQNENFWNLYDSITLNVDDLNDIFANAKFKNLNANQIVDGFELLASLTDNETYTSIKKDPFTTIYSLLPFSRVYHKEKQSLELTDSLFLNVFDADKVSRLNEKEYMRIVGFSKKETKMIVDALDASWNYEEEVLDFDYPDYGRLPESVSNRLSSDQVDALQEITDRNNLTVLEGLLYFK